MKTNLPFAVVLLAAGNSSRFCSNKLLTLVEGIPMYRHALQWASSLPAGQVVVVTQYEEIIRFLTDNFCPFQGVQTVLNEKASLGISHSMQLGLSSLSSMNDYDACLFSVCDQPWLCLLSVLSLLSCWQESSKGIACLSYGGKPGNPVIFDKKYFPELMSLTGDSGGRQIIAAHPEDVLFVEAAKEQELKDVDTKEDLPDLFL